LEFVCYVNLAGKKDKELGRGFERSGDKIGVIGVLLENVSLVISFYYHPMLCKHGVLSICLFVRLSITCWYSIKMAIRRKMQATPHS